MRTTKVASSRWTRAGVAGGGGMGAPSIRATKTAAMAGEGGVRLGVLRAGKVPVATLAAWSQTALDRPMAHDAVLWVAEALDEATVLGAFERGSSAGAGGLVVRRGSGRPRLRVGPGTLHVALSLVRPDALSPCDVPPPPNPAAPPLLP